MVSKSIGLLMSLRQSMKVLARIEDGKDILSADNFLPMANQCGLATEFDRQVVSGVFKHCLYRAKQDPQLQFFCELIYIKST